MRKTLVPCGGNTEESAPASMTDYDYYTHFMMGDRTLVPAELQDRFQAELDAYFDAQERSLRQGAVTPSLRSPGAQ